MTLRLITLQWMPARNINSNRTPLPLTTLLLGGLLVATVFANSVKAQLSSFARYDWGPITVSDSHNNGSPSAVTLSESGDFPFGDRSLDYTAELDSSSSASAFQLDASASAAVSASLVGPPLTSPGSYLPLRSAIVRANAASSGSYMVEGPWQPGTRVYLPVTFTLDGSAVATIADNDGAGPFLRSNAGVTALASFQGFLGSPVPSSANLTLSNTDDNVGGLLFEAFLFELEVGDNLNYSMSISATVIEDTIIKVGGPTSVTNSGTAIGVADLTFGEPYPVTPQDPEYMWANSSGGGYSVASNWSPEEVPGAESTARVQLAGEYPINLTENIENKRLVMGGGSNVVRPDLVLNGHRLKTEQFLIEPNGRVNIDGTGSGSVIEANLVNLADQASLEGDVWFKPTGGGLSLYLEFQSSLRPGQRGEDAPRRTHFQRSDSGPEPEEFYSHMVVRGDFFQEPASNLTLKLDERKAIRQSQFHENGAPLPSTDLYITGNADLQGTLNVVLEPGYEPEHGDSFSLIRGQVTTEYTSLNMPTVPDNGLKMVPVQTPHGVHAVVPQKVVLAFGEDLPVSLDPLSVFGITLFEENPLGSEDAFAPQTQDSAAFETYKTSLLQQVQKQYRDSGIEGVVFEIGSPEEDAINLYFIDESVDPTLFGVAYTGIDRLNSKAAGDAAIFVSSFFPTSPTNVEIDAETIAHEVGHLLGLRHIDPPGDLPIMDYDYATRGDVELFTNGVFNIWESPGDPNGTIFAETHNPMYHLRRYVDGVPHEDLIAMGILPGSWDLPGPVFEDLEAAFSFRLAEGTDMTLFDVIVYKAEGDPTGKVDVLARFAEITLAELAAQSFRINAGEGLGLFASSLFGGKYDISLAPGNPFESSSFVVYPGQGQLEAFLQMEADNPAGFLTLADVTLTASVIPEPSTTTLMSLALVCMVLFHRTSVNEKG